MVNLENYNQVKNENKRLKVELSILKERQEKCDTIFSNIQILLFCHNKKGVFTMMNNYMASLFNHNMSSPKSLALEDIVPIQYKKDLHEHLKVLHNYKKLYGHIRLITTQGEKLFYYQSNIHNANNKLNVIGAAYDVSSEIQKNKEIRSVLTTILGNCDLIKAYVDQPKYILDRCINIESSVQKVNHIIQTTKKKDFLK